MRSPLLNYIKQGTKTFVDLEMLKMQRRSVIKMHVSLVVSSPFLHKPLPTPTLDRHWRVDGLWRERSGIQDFGGILDHLYLSEITVTRRMGRRKIVAGSRRRQPDVVVRVQHYWCIDFCQMREVSLVFNISCFPENLLELVDTFSCLVNKAAYLHFYARKNSPEVVLKTGYPNKWVDTNLNDLTCRIWTNSTMGHLALKV